MKESSLPLRLGIWWLIISAAYWVLSSMGFGWTLDCIEVCTAVIAQDSAWWFNLLGLFVPLNPNNASLAAVYALKPVMLAFPATAGFFQTNAYAVTLVAVAFALGVGLYVTRTLERALWRIGFTPIIKMLANLLILLALTALADVIVFGGHWVSVEILKQSL